MKRLRVLYSCYACDPHRGGEHGIGWAWAMGMAQRHEVYVLTRAANRAVIEAELAQLKRPAASLPTFIYVELADFWLWLQRHGLLPIGLYYLLWQWKAPRVWDASGYEADIVHHVTIASFVFPGFWWRRKERVVLGPLGGTAICARAFLRLFPKRERWREWRRRYARLFFGRIMPLFRISRHYADAVYFTEAWFAEHLGGKKVITGSMIDVGVPEALEKRMGMDVERRNQFVWAGVLEPRKGLEIALRAFAKAFGGRSKRPTLKVIGEGSGLVAARALVKSLRLEGSVEFMGKLSQTELWEEMRRSIAFVFSSVRDTCGSVNLEAMACCCPIICFAHQGVREVTNESCAIQVEPYADKNIHRSSAGLHFEFVDTWDASIKRFGEAMEWMVTHREQANRMGRVARRHVMEHYTWKNKFDEMDRVYYRILNRM